MDRRITNVFVKLLPISLGLVAITLPWSTQLNSLSIIIAFMSTIGLFFMKKNQNLILKNRNFQIFTAYFIILLLGLLHDKFLTLGWSLVETKLSFVIFPLIFVQIKYLEKRHFVPILWSFVISCSLALTYLFVINFYYQNTNPISTLWGYGYFTNPLGIHPVYFSIYLIFSILIIGNYLKLNWHNIEFLSRLFVILLMGFLIFGVVFLQARMPLVILMVLIFTYFSYQLFFMHISARVVILSTTLVILMTAIIWSLTSIFNDRLDEMLRTAFDGRISGWKAVLQVVNSNFLFGVGTGDIQEELNKSYLLIGYDKGVDFGYNAHNEYLETLLRNGIFGLLSLSIIFINGIQRAFKKNNAIFLSFLVLMSISFLTESILNRQKGVVFFMLFYSILFHYDDDDKEKH